MQACVETNIDASKFPHAWLAGTFTVPQISLGSMCVMQVSLVNTAESETMMLRQPNDEHTPENQRWFVTLCRELLFYVSWQLANCSPSFCPELRLRALIFRLQVSNDIWSYCGKLPRVDVMSMFFRKFRLGHLE